MYVRLTSRPTEIVGRINKLAGFPESEPIKLFEEIKFDPTVMCEPIDKKLTFKGSQVSQESRLVCDADARTQHLAAPFARASVCAPVSPGPPSP